MPNSVFQFMHLSSCCISSHSSLVYPNLVIKPTQHITQGNVIYSAWVHHYTIIITFNAEIPIAPQPPKFQGKHREGKEEGKRKGEERRGETIRNWDSRKLYQERCIQTETKIIGTHMCRWDSAVASGHISEQCSINSMPQLREHVGPVSPHREQNRGWWVGDRWVHALFHAHMILTSGSISEKYIPAKLSEKCLGHLAK